MLELIEVSNCLLFLQLEWFEIESDSILTVLALYVVDKEWIVEVTFGMIIYFMIDFISEVKMDNKNIFMLQSVSLKKLIYFLQK
jgi:hypothetical protein